MNRAEYKLEAKVEGSMEEALVKSIMATINESQTMQDILAHPEWEELYVPSPTEASMAKLLAGSRGLIRVTRFLRHSLLLPVP